MSKLIEELKNKSIERFLEEHLDSINSIDELTAGEEPSALFYLWMKLFGYLMSNDPEAVVSKRGIELRQKISPYLRKVAKGFLMNPQVFESRNELALDKDAKRLYVPRDKEIVIPDEPTIWIANHSFKDDTLASILAIPRQATILFGSLPQFYNTIDGLTGWLIGVVMVNRNNKESRKASLEKCKKVMEYGGDMFIFPEGAWERTPNRLVGEFWPGFYHLAQETGAKIVPMTHYISDPTAVKDPNIFIHTVIDDPVDVSNMSEKEAIDYFKELMATRFNSMMERYGNSSRAEELGDFKTTHEAWSDKLDKRIATVGRYHREIENLVSYIPKDRVNPETVWSPIANSTNDPNQKYAQELVRTRKKEDYQNNF